MTFPFARKREKGKAYLSVRGQVLYYFGDGFGYPPEIIYRDLLQFIAEIYLSRVYETDEMRLSPGDVVLDCSANWGVYAIWSARQVGASGKVFAFEPEQINFDLLSRYMVLNKLTNVTPSRVAISDKQGRTEFSITPKTGAHFILEPGLPGMFPTVTTVAVSCSTIDTLVFDDLELERVDCIKMVVEGHEVSALKKAGEVIRKFAPQLAISVYYYNGRDKYLIKHLLEGFSDSYVMRFSPLEEMLYAWPADNPRE